MKFILFLVLIVLSQYSLAKSKAKSIIKIQATVVSCHDADTCKMKSKDKNFKVRFSGIDAPEAKQNEGKLAKNFLVSTIVDKVVDLECEGKSFDRTTCTVFLNGTNINEELVKMGFAFDSPKYSKGRYEKAMKEARLKKIGIWRTLDVSPYCFRHKTSKKCVNNKMYME